MLGRPRLEHRGRRVGGAIVDDDHLLLERQLLQTSDFGDRLPPR